MGEWVSGEKGGVGGVGGGVCVVFKKVGKAQKVFTSPSTHNDGGCAGGAKIGCTVVLVLVLGGVRERVEG